MAELNKSIIKWINELPISDQEELNNIDHQMELLIDLLKEGVEMKMIRELYRKLSDDLDREES
jgi:hypothetical protein